MKATRQVKKTTKTIEVEEEVITLELSRVQAMVIRLVFGGADPKGLKEMARCSALFSARNGDRIMEEFCTADEDLNIINALDEVL